ncbi:MAG: hypothetical protein ACOCV2_01285 [Persicimonas sp.]
MKPDSATPPNDRVRGARPPVRAAAVAVLIGLLSIVGCSNADQSDLDESGVNCHENADCSQGRECKSGFCSTSFTSDEVALDFRFITTSSSDYLNQIIGGVTLRQDRRAHFGLERAITVSGGGDDEGGVRYTDGDRTAPSGTLVFRPEGVDDALFVREAQVDEGEFSVRITPGRYEMTFVPAERSAHPKSFWPDERFEQNTALELTLPGDYVEVDGTLKRDAVSANGEVIEQQSIAGAHVYAVSDEGRHTSSVATTDERGDFELVVEPDSGLYDIHVVPAEATEPIPSLRYDGVFEVSGDECETASGVVDSSCQLSTLNLGAYPSSTVEMPVALESSDDSPDDNWSGTRLIVEGSLGDGDFRGDFAVDEDGEATLELFPSMEASDQLSEDYVIEIIPPVHSPLARTRHNLAEAARVDDVTTLSVDTKQPISGRVTTSDSDALGNARVEFREVRGDREAVGDDRVITSTTEDDGSFEVWLAAADYQVEVIPPDSSGQPRLFTEVSADQIESGEEFDFELPEPSVILGAAVGTDRADDGDGLGGMTVEAYRRVDGRTVVYGQARTDDRGYFRMALPSNLE